MNAEAKLVIETAAPTSKPATTPVVSTPAATPNAATPPVQNSPASYKEMTSNSQSDNSSSHTASPITTGGKKSLLAVLQQKYGNDYNIEEVKDAISLNMETLQQCWNDYAVQMEKELKHSVAGTFKTVSYTHLTLPTKRIV